MKRMLVLSLALLAPIPVWAALNPEIPTDAQGNSTFRPAYENISKDQYGMVVGSVTHGSGVPMKNDMDRDAEPYFIQDAVKGDYQFDVQDDFCLDGC